MPHFPLGNQSQAWDEYALYKMHEGMCNHAYSGYMLELTYGELRYSKSHARLIPVRTVRFQINTHGIVSVN